MQCHGVSTRAALELPATLPTDIPPRGRVRCCCRGMGRWQTGTGSSGSRAECIGNALLPALPACALRRQRLLPACMPRSSAAHVVRLRPRLRGSAGNQATAIPPEQARGPCCWLLRSRPGVTPAPACYHQACSSSLQRSIWIDPVRAMADELAIVRVVVLTLTVVRGAACVEWDRWRILRGRARNCRSVVFLVFF